jgi:outer membrane protein OmpA-like peptidoglycan-associated protein
LKTFKVQRINNYYYTKYLFSFLFSLFPLPYLFSQIPENLGEAINSEQDESAPVISFKGNVLYFWSLNRPDGFGFHDIYYTRLDTSGKWVKAQNIGQPVNDAGANIVLSIMPDGKQLLIYQDSPAGKDKKPKPSDLAIVKKIGNLWSSPQFLKIENYKNTSGLPITAYLAVDKKTLLLSLYNEADNAQEDLYVCFWQPEKKQFSSPKSLGAAINTPHEEITPFLAPDGVTLYFSSNRPGGLGNHDIYMTQRLDSSWQNWSPAKNLGLPINSSADEMHFKFAADPSYAYFVSTAGNGHLGGKDIYKVALPERLQPMPVVMVSGRVMDAANKTPQAARITYYDINENREVGTAYSDSVSGEYTIFLPAEKEFAIIAQGENYVAISENLSTIGLKRFALVQRDLFLAPLQINTTVPLNSLFFEIGKSTLQEKSFVELDRIAALMEKNPGMYVEINGHTDNTGDESFNKILSLDRANAVAQYLIAQKINPERIITKGWGSAKPVADNATQEGRDKNRRVEIKITKLK